VGVGVGEPQQPRLVAVDTGAMLGFQRLDVYQCSVRLLALSARICEEIPRGYGSLSDQLRRAAISVPLNVAEATGRSTDTDSARFFSIARGSAMECGAIIDAIAAIGAPPHEAIQEASRLVVRIVEMLTKMCR
jgi:four helix bundle protein